MTDKDVAGDLGLSDDDDVGQFDPPDPPEIDKPTRKPRAKSEFLVLKSMEGKTWHQQGNQHHSYEDAMGELRNICQAGVYAIVTVRKIVRKAKQLVMTEL